MGLISKIQKQAHAGQYIKKKIQSNPRKWKEYLNIHFYKEGMQMAKNTWIKAEH